MTVTGRTAKVTDACPHGSILGKCADSWCRGRVEDLLHGEYQARPLESPETSGEARSPDALERREQRLTWREHFSELKRIGVSPAVPERAEVPGWAFMQYTGTCGGCRTWWRGAKICHCAACHLTFTSIGGFDAHRTGPMSKRRCWSESELRDHGYEPNDSGHWRQPRPPDTIPQKETTHGANA